jgi:hypothetical protein
MEEEFKQFISVEIDSDGALDNVVRLTKAIEDNKEATKKLKDENKEFEKDYAKNKTAIDANIKAIESNNATVKNLTTALNANRKVVQAGLAETDSEVGAYQRKQQVYSALAQRVKDLAVIYGLESEAVKEASKQANAMADELKAIDASVGQNQRNVGNYTGAIEASASSILGMRQKLQLLKTDLDKMDINSAEFVETKKTIDSLSLAVDQASGKVDEFGNREPKNMAKKNFEDTLITVGILSGSIGALSEAFGENENVQEALVKTQKALVLSQTLANVVKEKGAILDTIQLVKDKALIGSKFLLTNAVRIFGITSAGAWAMATLGLSAIITAVVLLIGNFDKITAGLKAFFGIADKFKDKRADIDAMSKSMENYGEKTSLQVDRMKAQGKTDKEIFDFRKKRYEEQLAKEKELYTSLSKLGNKATDEEKARLKEATEFIKKSGFERYKFDTELIALNNKRKEKVEVDYQSDLKKRETLLAISIEKQKEVTFEGLQAQRKMEQDMLDIRVKNGLVTKEEETLERLKLDNKYNDAVNALTQKNYKATIDQMKLDLELDKLEVDEKIANNKLLSDAKYKNGLELLDKENAIKKAEIENSKMTEQEKIDAMLLLDAQYRAKKTELDKANIDETKKYEADRLKADFDNRMALAQGDFEAEQTMKAEQRAIAMAKELEDAKTTGANVDLIKEKYSQMEIEADKAVLENKLGQASQLLGGLATIAGEGTQASKAFASAQIAIDTTMGAMKAFAQAGNPILGAVLAGAVVATGLRSIQKVWAVKNGQKNVSNVAGNTGGRVSAGEAQRNAKEMPSEAILRTQKTEPTIVPVLVTNNLTEKMETKVQVTNNSSL